MEEHLIIILIIIGAGLLGGMTNFLMLFDINLKSRECWIKLFASISLSLCASFTVPLFLQILSNNLLDTLSFKNLLIFSGFCVLAAIFSKRYLEDLYSKVKNLERKVDKHEVENKEELKESIGKTEAINKKVEDLEESIEESEYESIPSEIKTAISSNKSLTFSEQQVEDIIKPLFSSKYSWRTAVGISKEAKIGAEEISKVLEHLRDYGFAESKVINGKDFWRILKHPIKIYSAEFGIPGKFAAVTSKIRALISKGIYEGIASFDFLEIPDPAPGYGKIFKIHYRIHGREKEFTVNEWEKFKVD